MYLYGQIDKLVVMIPGASDRKRFVRIPRPVLTLWTSLTSRRQPTAQSTPPQVLESETVVLAQPAISLRDQERVQKLQEDLGLRFNSSTLVREALTHRSYLNEIDQAWPSNERLEFLGDSVLGLISTDYLFHRFPDLGEGELTNLRSALVRTETLARFSQAINLGKYLFLGRGEEMSRGRHRPGGLACAFEALLGAVYIDAGYEAARTFALRFIEPELTTVVEGRLHKNAKSLLQELVQSRMQQTPTYYLVEETGPDHAKSFTVEVRIGNRVLGRGHERSKRSAEQAAAEAALEQINEPIPRQLGTTA
ncbi:MAG: hypothetical protein NVSMB52_09180 [Chloroflexota bacterium]